ncbi:MAG: hypothetical protein BroJett029_04810 [Alphaproteobacteria bacterium]|nr:MAG: hypothetical protein BroJett029_04810 [Alphaproteobacteria bacterium]
MRSTIIVPNGWAADCVKLEMARAGRIGVRVLPLDYAVARLAGGFLRPIDRIAVLDAVRDLAADGKLPPEFRETGDLPGFVRAAASTLMKVWAAGIDLKGRAAEHPRIASLAILEDEILPRLPPSMRRPVELRRLALERLAHAPAILGPVRIVGRTEMSPVWRPLMAALARVVLVTWVAGARAVPPWLDPAIEAERAVSPVGPRRVYSCGDGAHEALEAIRWAKDWIAGGPANPEEIAICAAAPAAFDAEMASLADAAGLPVHFIHGRRAVEGREGQEAAALADILLAGPSLQRFRRLAGFARGSAFEGLPEDWRRVLPRDATLTTLERWRVFVSEIADWPGGTPFGDRLMELLSLLDGGAEAAREAGRMFLGAKARALWERALLEGPADALLTSLGSLAAKDDVEGQTSVVWGSAAVIASYPRPYVRMIGLNAGSWPRNLSEDPLLPDHVIRQEELDPLPAPEADRRDFETILACAGAEVAMSRSRRGTDGRLLAPSPLFPLEEEQELTKARAPERAASRGDRLAARPDEFVATPGGIAARDTWRDWHVPAVMPHDGRIRSDHPLILEALGRPMSASTITLLLRNPIGWMFKEALSLDEPEAEEEPLELDPLGFGNLVHGIIERAVVELEGNGGLAHAPDDAVREACAMAAREVAGAFEMTEPVPPARIWRQTVSRALAMAGAALLPSFLAPLAGQRSWAEIPFGRVHRRYEGDPAALPWNPEAEVRIGETRVSGKVDRLDLAGNGRAARVIDWKSGRAPRDVPDIIGGGAEVQRPIYAAAVRQLTGSHEIEAGLAYLRDGGEWHALAEPDEALTLLVRRLDAMREAARAGLLLPGPAAGDDYDDFALALPGNAKLRYLEEKAPAIREALGQAAAVWDDR